MTIPRIIHQLWKTHDIPPRWREASASVRKYHKGWEYRLWTDDAMDKHVRVNHPELYPSFMAMNRHIMRVDVFRYVLMNDFGGVYCDLDFEFLRPFDYSGADVWLSLEYDEAYGDEVNQISNYILASVPGHQLWQDIVASVQANPPFTPTPGDVCMATGPRLVTRTYYRHPERYSGVRLTPKPVFSPRRVHGRYERKHYLNSGVTYGFHYGWGSWRERFNLPYLRHRLAKVFRLKTAPKPTPPALS
ncbi:MAG TPA: glycosyltransferase [Gammaproteobacteria bacterium]|nr:glycosyltransferase [Gammaproteobacteria bacterium]